MTIKLRVDESSEGEQRNVAVETSDCAVTALVLEARARAPLTNRPSYNLPIKANDTTRFFLEPGEYVFIVSFKNDEDKGAVTIVVDTDADQPMEPEGPLSVTAEQFETGSMAFLVTVT